MSVQALLKIQFSLVLPSFNTSYVSVQAITSHFLPLSSTVSIHPMCRFKVRVFYSLFNLFNVSIHPMCRFKILLGNSVVYVA